MPQDCVVNCDIMLTVKKSRLTRRIASLTPARMDEVNEALRFALELP
jgi:mRNA-degrading endonuclease toxin of MazEF toxin-antitoxin module